MPRRSTRKRKAPPSTPPQPPMKTSSRITPQRKAPARKKVPAKKKTPAKKKAVTGLKGVAAPPAKAAQAAMAVGSIDSGFEEKHPKVAKSGVLKYDARLVLVDPSQNMDKYYIIQVVVNKTKASCWQRWGRTGTSGQSKFNEGSVADMVKVFEDKFEQKTGVSYYDVVSGGAVPISGKYQWLAVAENSKGIKAKWQYYVSDHVDGKATGWYDYEEDASKIVESLYHDFVVAKNQSMGERFVQSGRFLYKVDLTSSSNYTQTNTTTNKQRKIRRRVDSTDVEMEDVVDDEEEEEEEEEVDEEDEEEEEDSAGTTIPVDCVALLRFPDANVFKEYGCILNQCNLGSSNNNKAYHIQLLQSPSFSGFQMFTRWNRVGETGQHKFQPFGDEEAAIAAFEKQFKAKTANNWGDRKNFVKKNKKYELIEMDLNTAASSAASSKTKVKVPTSKLDADTQRLVKMIFSDTMFKASMAEIGLDTARMPLGSLSKDQIDKAYQVLVQIEMELRGKRSSAKLSQLSADFYTKFPHATGRQRPPTINNEDLLQKKYDLVAEVSDIEQAQSLMKEGEMAKVTVNPIDAKYDTLKNKLRKVKPTSEEFKVISKYVERSTGRSWRKLKLLNCWEADRNGDAQRAKKNAKMGNHKLLWHGTSVSVVAAILKSGLRIMPHSGGRVGRGIYLASEQAKSIQYTRGTDWTGRRRCIMFLVEAALGVEKEITRDDPSLVQPPKGYNSVVARGSSTPVGVEDVVLKVENRNVTVPLGEAKPSKCPQSNFRHDEYLVYDESQQRIKYVLEFEEN